MKSKLIKYIALLSLFFMTIAVQCFAQTMEPLNIVTTSVPFLRISPDARAGGMGDVGIATSADANAMFWNQAKIPFAESKTSLSVNYNPWLKNIAKSIYLASISGYTQLDDKQAISLSMRYFHLGQVQFTDFDGNELQRYQPREFSFDMGYSRKLSSKFGLGLALRYINSSLATGLINGENYKAGSAVAADISVYHNGTDASGKGFSWGVSLSNLGSKIGYTSNANEKDFIPANAGAGIAYTTLLDANSKITLALDANKQLVPGIKYTGDTTVDAASLAKYKTFGVTDSWFKPNNAYSISAGAEFAYSNQLFLRAGYFYEDEMQGNRQYYTMGAGLKNKLATFNFSYLVPSGKNLTISPLANTIRVSLLFELSKANK
jgi:hypothetical protein